MTDNSANTKRLRIDPTAFLSRNKTTPDRSQKSQDGKAATPTAAALLQIDDCSASLFPQLRPILLTSCKPFLQLSIKQQGKISELQSATEAIRIAEDEDNTELHPQWPRSTNLKFRLSVDKDTLSTPEFVTLQRKTGTYVNGERERKSRSLWR